MLIAHSIDRSDPWPTRLAIANTFELLVPSFTDDILVPWFNFLIHKEALGDRHPDVRRGILQAGTVAIDTLGAKRLAELIGMFEEYLATTNAASEVTDSVKEAVVILFGRVARHLDPSDSRIPQIVKRLVEALKTPAEQVQIAVSDCLSPLVRLQPSEVGGLVDQLFEDLLNFGLASLSIAWASTIVRVVVVAIVVTSTSRRSASAAGVPGRWCTIVRVVIIVIIARATRRIVVAKAP